jgi:4-carboxymuconolactone decarboxylase
MPLKTSTSSLCLIAASAACNNQQELADAICHALDAGIAPGHIYEIILQTYLFAGFPAALEGVRTFESILKEKKIAFAPSAPEKFDVEKFRARGTELCKQIYSTNYEKLVSSLNTLSPELAEWMIVEGYGKVLSRAVDGLDAQTRELANVTMLAALGWLRQLVSHARGAINTGASVNDVLDAIELAKKLADAEKIEVLLSEVLPHLPVGK